MSSKSWRNRLISWGMIGRGRCRAHRNGLSRSYIRSWTSDALGVFDADYVWHDLALKWQPSEIGEQVVAQMAGMSAEARAHQHESYGMTSAIAQKVAAGASVDIGKAVLAVYRSAAQPVMRDLGSGLSRATTKRGLALIATDDPTAAARCSRALCQARRRTGRGFGRSGSLVDVSAARKVLTRSTNF